MSVHYFALGDHHSKRPLNAASIGEALTMLRPGEIVSSERTDPVDAQIRAHARTVVQYRNLHRRTLSDIRRSRQRGALSGKSLVNLLNEAAAYRRMFRSHRKALRTLLDCASIESCNEHTCAECRQEIA